MGNLRARLYYAFDPRTNEIQGLYLDYKNCTETAELIVKHTNRGMIVRPRHREYVIPHDIQQQLPELVMAHAQLFTR